MGEHGIIKIYWSNKIFPSNVFLFEKKKSFLLPQWYLGGVVRSDEFDTLLVGRTFFLSNIAHSWQNRLKFIKKKKKKKLIIQTSKIIHIAVGANISIVAQNFTLENHAYVTHHT